MVCDGTPGPVSYASLLIWCSLFAAKPLRPAASPLLGVTGSARFRAKLPTPLGLSSLAGARRAPRVRGRTTGARYRCGGTRFRQPFAALGLTSRDNDLSPVE